MSDPSAPSSTPPTAAPVHRRHARPADACPYPRPFPAGFRACPSFHPAPFTPENTSHRRLPAQTTCAHLEVGEEPGAEGCFYPACGLGTAAQRAAKAVTTPGR